LGHVPVKSDLPTVEYERVCHAVAVRVLAFLIVLVTALAAPLAVPATAGNRWPHNAVSGFATPSGRGWWLLYADGDVAAVGDAHNYGSAVQLPLNAPIVGGTVLRTGTGYWLVAADGGIFTYGRAQFYGSMGSAHLNQPVFSMAATRSGHGYWLVARDGGIFTFGDAHFFGSTGSLRLAQPIVGITRTLSGRGYRLVARDGGIFSFGDAKYYGSLPSRGIHVTDVVGIARTPTGNGYWIAQSDGAVDAFGNAKTFRPYVASSCNPVTAIFSHPNRLGYQLVTRSGATVTFGAYGAHMYGTAPRCQPRRRRR